MKLKNRITSCFKRIKHSLGRIIKHCAHAIIAFCQKLIGYFDIRDICVFGGIGLFGYGAHLIYLPAGYITSGALLFYVGLFAGRPTGIKTTENR